MSLRWEEQKNLGFSAWWAYSGTLVIAIISERENGRFGYTTASSVSMKYIAKAHGEVNSLASAKRAIHIAWSRWLDRAGLEQKR